MVVVQDLQFFLGKTVLLQRVDKVLGVFLAEKSLGVLPPGSF